ncbi:MAG: sulfite oxidase-like oxidoreductase [Bryobacteraceae bacterium]|nr:sulfite oxidase-like oxidoreductase [Bryobacteraceae bacterium]
MFGRDPKEQPDRILTPGDAPPGAIVSPDTHRANRVPPGQSRTKKWPVLDASGPPRIDMAKWRLQIAGLVNNPIELTWADFEKLPRVKVFADFHCVTRWSRLGNVWDGVSTKHLLDLAGGAKPEAKFVVAHGYDHGWTTNLPLDRFLAEDALVAIAHDGEPLTAEHGGPARLMVPQLYAWKSAKWLGGIELIDRDRAGFWERNGYHMNGDPWKEERFGLNY